MSKIEKEQNKNGRKTEVKIIKITLRVTKYNNWKYNNYKVIVIFVIMAFMVIFGIFAAIGIISPKELFEMFKSVLVLIAK